MEKSDINPLHVAKPCDQVNCFELELFSKVVAKDATMERKCMAPPMRKSSKEGECKVSSRRHSDAIGGIGTGNGYTSK